MSHFLKAMLCFAGAALCVFIIFIEFTHGILGIGPIRVAKLWILVVILLLFGVRELRN